MGFFDDLRKKVAETTSSFQETTNKIEKENKCKKAMKENDNKLEKLYIDLGKKVYELEPNTEEFNNVVNEKKTEIASIMKENENLRIQILTLNNKKICSGCGAEIDMNTTFCPQCGKEQEKVEVKEVIPAGKRKCSGCGEIIDDNNLFCPNCGTKKEDASSNVAKEVEVDELAEADEEKKVEE